MQSLKARGDNLQNLWVRSTLLKREERILLPEVQRDGHYRPLLVRVPEAQDPP